MSLLSPGVEVQEIDASTIVPSVSNSVACFSGNFIKGPVDTYLLISNEDELVEYYGKSTKSNYNDWGQASSFLQYGDQLLISRACNYNGTFEHITTVASDVDNSSTVPVNDASSINVDDYVAFGSAGGDPVAIRYLVTAVDTSNNTITLDRNVTLNTDDDVYSIKISDNSTFEAVEDGGNAIPDNDYLKHQLPILNYDDFETKESSIAFTSTSSKIKFISRNPGAWGNDIKIAIAKPSDFGNGNYAFDGIALDDLYEYIPDASNGEIAIIVKYEDTIKEIYTVSLNEGAVDENNKSIYIEDVINRKSSYIFVKLNTANSSNIKSYIYGTNASTDNTFKLVNGLDSPIGNDDLLRAYFVWDNIDEVDVDCIIANELDDGESATELVNKRKDCLCFIGANRQDTVGLKSAIILQNLINWRESGSLNLNNMFVVTTGNYLYMYNKYLDAYKWINCAGTVAGLRCQTNTNRDAWWASAGLERGQIQGVVKLAFNPTVAQRDQMYKRGINPIVSFAGQGIVMWGQKTLLDKPSSFDRVNVRSLFNTLERSLRKMARYQIMEFNDPFTRNRIVSMIKPFLSGVKAGRGIQDYLVICDESNNTPDIVQRNELVVDIYIKPTYVAEFIRLRFTNAGTNSFSEIINS